MAERSAYTCVALPLLYIFKRSDGVRSVNTHVKPGDAVTFFATLPDHQQAVLVDEAKVSWS
jgi:hypothetical protein